MRIAGSVLCWALSCSGQAVNSTAMPTATMPMDKPVTVLMSPLLSSLPTESWAISTRMKDQEQHHPRVLANWSWFWATVVPCSVAEWQAKKMRLCGGEDACEFLGDTVE